MSLAQTLRDVGVQIYLKDPRCPIQKVLSHSGMSVVNLRYNQYSLRRLCSGYLRLRQGDSRSFRILCPRVATSLCAWG